MNTGFGIGKKSLLDCRYTGHLHGCLESTAEEQAAERRSALEQLDVRLGLILVLVRDTLLDLGVLGLNPGVMLVAMGMEFGQRAQTLLGSAVVDQPTRRLYICQYRI